MNHSRQIGGRPCSGKDFELLAKRFRQAEMIADAHALNLAQDLCNQLKTKADCHPVLPHRYRALVELFARKPVKK